MTSSRTDSRGRASSLRQYEHRLQNIGELERSYQNLGRSQNMTMADEAPVAREIQASIYVLPKNKHKWTGLDMLQEHNDRIGNMRGKRE